MAERRRRQAFFEEASEFTPYLAAFVGEELYFVRTDDPRVGRDVFVRRKREDQYVLAKTMKRLSRFGSLPKDPVFVDVGANIGTTTVAALRRHGFASAVAIEPSSETSRTLRLNVAVNDLDDRVQALPFAVGDVEGVAGLDMSRDPGRHRLADATEAGAEVEVVTLDALVRRGVVDPARVGLLWIDVQGHEPQVLAGASALIGAAVPVVATIRAQAPWPPELIEQTTAAYTHVVELRKRQDRTRRPQPIEALPEILSTLPRIQDILLFRGAERSRGSEGQRSHT